MRCATEGWTVFYPSQVDTYSYGVLLWELVTKQVPQRGHMRDLRVPQECAPSLANVFLLPFASFP